MVRRQKILLLLILLLVHGGCASPTADSPKIHTSSTSVYVVSHGWHTGIVVKRDDIPDSIWPEHNDFPEAQYLEIGWGDKDFYQAPKATLGLALKAALQPTSSVLHIVGFNVSIEEYFPESDIIEVGLSQQGFENLCTFIHETYEKDESGNTIQLGPGLYGNSQFYLAKGKYHIFNTSNNWTAKALRAAGYPITPASAMTAGNVIDQTSKFGRIIRLKPGKPTFKGPW